jgi:hypothetical protein
VPAELRRRDLDQKIEPLRSAEPTLVSDPSQEQSHPASDQNLRQMTTWIRDLEAQRQAFRARFEARQG